MFIGSMGSPAWTAAGWTMIHFLWIGTLMGVGCWLGRLALRRAPPPVRYGFALGSLLALAGTAGALFAIQWHRASPHALAPVAVDNGTALSARPAVAMPAEIGNSVTRPPSVSEGSTRTSPVSLASNYHWHTFLEAMADQVPWIWLIGSPLTLLVIGLGLAGTNRLQRQSLINSDGWLEELRERLQHSLCLARQVVVAVNDRVTTPILVGVIRPMILLPPAVLTGYTREQVAMILVHELAHVQRLDPLVNLIQRWIEGLLFFHPMVWVVSRWVRVEREDCCDALVVRHTGNPDAYAEALVRMASASAGILPAPALAVARHPVVGRIRRILQVKDHGAPRGGGALSVVAALALLGLLLPRLWAGAVGTSRTDSRDAENPSQRAAKAGQADAADLTAPAARLSRASVPRVLHLPADRSLGNLRVQDGQPSFKSEFYLDRRSSRQWRTLGPAKGRVTVPAGQRIWLAVSAAAALQDLSPLSKLGPNDLEELSISGWGVPGLNADNAILPHIGHLTGLESLALDQVQISEHGLAHLQGFTALRHLSIKVAQGPLGQEAEAEGLTDACLEQLAPLRSLETLVLSTPKISDAGLAALAKLPHLQELELWSADIPDAGWAHLQKTPGLRLLRLGGSALSDASLEPISGIRSLRLLHLEYPPIGESGVASLGKLIELQELNFVGRRLTAQGVGPLKSLGKLKRLEIGRGDSSQPGREDPAEGDGIAAQLSGLSSLEHLSLGQFGLTDNGLKSLAKLARLKSLHIPATMATEPGKNNTYGSAGLEALSRLGELEELEICLYGPGSNDTALAQLAALKKIKRLWVYTQRVTNAGLAGLSSLKSVEQLCMYLPEVTISGLNSLNGLTNLRHLTLTGIRQDNSGLNLSKLTQLEVFSLTMRQTFEQGVVKADSLRDADLAWLNGLTRLRWLQGLQGISDAGMKYLVGLKSLEMLQINASRVTDVGLACLASLKNLDTFIYQGSITDQGLRHLEGLRSLRVLNINDLDKQISPAALERMRRNLPELWIINGTGIGAAGGG